MARATGVKRFGLTRHIKSCSTIILIVLTVFSSAAAFAQKKDASMSTAAATQKTYKMMVDYSRPGKYHQLLANLAGKWTFKGKHYVSVDATKSKSDFDVSGTLLREPFANGRYFVVHIVADSSSDFKTPVQNGKMLPATFRGVDVEGYDNVKKKFVTSSIGNDLYSSIVVSEGSYDPTSKTIAYRTEYEPIPGMKTKEHLLVTFIDNNHYKMEISGLENGKFRKGMTIDLIRSN